MGKGEHWKCTSKRNSRPSRVGAASLDCRMLGLWIALVAQESKLHVPSVCSATMAGQAFGRGVATSVPRSARPQPALWSTAQQSAFSDKSCVCKPRLILDGNNPQETLIACSMVTSSTQLKATAINYQTIDHQPFLERETINQLIIKNN